MLSLLDFNSYKLLLNHTSVRIKHIGIWNISRKLIQHISQRSGDNILDYSYYTLGSKTFPEGSYRMGIMLSTSTSSVHPKTFIKPLWLTYNFGRPSFMASLGGFGLPSSSTSSETLQHHIGRLPFCILLFRLVVSKRVFFVYSTVYSTVTGRPRSKKQQKQTSLE